MNLAKTIFITIYDGAVSQNILRTDVFRILKEHAKIVLFVQKDKEDYFREQFGSSGVLIEVLPEPSRPAFERIFSRLALYGLPTRTVFSKIRYGWLKNKKVFLVLFELLLWILGHAKIFRLLLRRTYNAVPDNSFDIFFEKYSPSAVFAPNLVSDESFRLVKGARRRGVTSFGMPKGFDNLTSKTFFGVHPDWLLVQMPMVKEHAIRFMDFPKDKILAAGFSRFDIYKNKGSIVSRQEFCQKLGLDPLKKIILYAGAGDQMAPYDEEILADLLKSIEEGKVTFPAQVLVRPHPKYKYRSEILSPSPLWVLDLPGKRVGRSVEFEKEDVAHLMNSLVHCDVLVHTASTLALEASIFDRPNISIGFDGDRILPLGLSVSRYYEYEHYKSLVDTGGIKVVFSPQELVSALNEYLSDPSRDSEGRKLIASQVGEVGSAGQRTAEFILDKLNARP